METFLHVFMQYACKQICMIQEGKVEKTERKFYTNVAEKKLAKCGCHKQGQPCSNLYSCIECANEYGQREKCSDIQDRPLTIGEKLHPVDNGRNLSIGHWVYWCLQKVYKGLQGCNGVYKGILGFQGYTRVYKGIEGHSRVYKGILGFSRVYWGLQGYARVFKGNYYDIKGYTTVIGYTRVYQARARDTRVLLGIQEYPRVYSSLVLLF